MYYSVSEFPPPLNVLLRTHMGDEFMTQKAFLKEDGWYYPDNETPLLDWEPTHYQIVEEPQL